MATTSVHLPPDLLEALDRLAAERGTSRNRLIVASCQEMLDRHRDAWPSGYLAGDHLSEEDRALLAEGASDFAERLRDARVRRAEAPF